MLPFLVIVATHPRRSPRSENVQTCQRSNVQTSFTPNSFALTLLADPHPLAPVASIFYKNIGGRGASTFPARKAQKPVAHLLLFSITCAMPLAQLLSFDNYTFSWGAWGMMHFFDVRTFRPADVSTCFGVIPFVLIFLRTLLHGEKC